MFTYVDNEKSAKIKVIGVGGAGGNAINNMIASNLQGVKFIAANTDAQALEISQASIRIQLGEGITEGLGAGANPQVGRDAALENEEDIREALADRLIWPPSRVPVCCTASSTTTAPSARARSASVLTAC